MGLPAHGGGRSLDIIKQVLEGVVNVFKKRTAPCTAPCDGWVLKMHYQWTFWVMLGTFSGVWYSWFHRDVIICASNFNADAQVRLDYTNVCLSYPYIEEAGERRYLLFYRWIHWVMLLLAALYYVPRRLSKSAENVKVKKLFEDLSVGLSVYDNKEKDMVDRATRYMAYNMKTHDALFYKYLMCNVVCFIIDILTFLILDYVLQNRFIFLGVKAYPFDRDLELFTDYLSQTFPPFADCELNHDTQLTNKRTETFGCHLTVMELYEKLFVVIWLWLVILSIITCLHLVYLGCFWSPWARRQLLRISKPVIARDSIRNTVVSVIDNCKIGDIYLLYRLRHHFSHARYYELLLKLSNTDFLKIAIDGVSIDQQRKGGQQPDNRQRFKGRPNSGKPNKGILVD